MKYMGSKNRIAKYILPIMLNEAKKRKITSWIEPMVGGGNMIDKVPKEFNRVGIDFNPHTIEALIGIRDLVDVLPDDVSEDYYGSIKGTNSDPITSLIRFGASFGGKFENGYARSFASNGTRRNHWGEAKRNAKLQSSKLKGVKLIHDSYDQYNFKDCLIYCDPPYQGTSSYKTGEFDHNKFWDWCREMSKENLVFISEYNAPEDFVCMWNGEVKTNFASQRSKATHDAIEKLFVHLSQYTPPETIPNLFS